MRNKYFKYICLLSLGAFCYSCSDDNTENVGGGSGEGEQGTEQEIVRSYKLGTLAGFEGDLRTKMDIPFTQSTVMYNRSLFYRYIASAYPDQIAPEPPATPEAEEPKSRFILPQSPKRIGGIILWRKSLIAVRTTLL